MLSNLGLSNLFLLASFAAGAVIQDRATTTAKCNAANVKFVNTHASHAVYFCDFYLSYPRINSPFELLSPSDTWSACKCIAASATTPRKYKTVTAPTDSKCSAWTKVLADEFVNPRGFCEFYMFQDRTRSSISGLSAAQVQKACNCLTSGSASSTETTRTTTVTSTKSTAKTTTSTCPLNALATSAGNFASGLALWTTTAAPTAHASVAKATGLSSTDGSSAALLKCKYTSKKTDAYASICSRPLNVCMGQTYKVSFKYKFPSSASYIGGSLSLYDYGWDANLALITGPKTNGGSDGAGVKAGTWGSVGGTFQAVRDGDRVCILLQCLSGQGTVGQTAQVVVDQVRVVRV